MRTKIISGFLALIFVWFAYLQFNDPDPILWVIIYLLTAAGAAALFFGKASPKIALAVLALTVLWALTLAPGVYSWMTDSQGDLLHGMSDDKPYIEESREALGLLISAGAWLYLYFAGRKIQKK